MGTTAPDEGGSVSAWDQLQEHCHRMFIAECAQLEEDLAEAIWSQGDGMLDRLVIIDQRSLTERIPRAVASMLQPPSSPAP